MARPEYPNDPVAIVTKTAAALGKTAAGRAAKAFPVVAVGASAGGLEALEQFLANVPPGSGMAFVVIQHLDPNHKGLLPELLQRATSMPVAQARNRMKVKPDCVYVIPPNHDLSILHNSLSLLDPVAPRGMRLPIDFFFRALAADQHENAIGVVLSGMGSDGTLGLRAIKEHGGLVLAQDPASAKFDSMPRHAIDTGLVDIVAPAAELALRIGDTLHHSAAADPMPAPMHTETAQRSALAKVCILLRARTGHDFSHYKTNTLYRRIERRIAIHQLDRMADYVRYLRENAHELDLLFKELLIGVTSFFRDPTAWNTLQEQVLPELLAGYPPGSTLRAWVAGCSTGEEAYSLAIAFREAVDSGNALRRHSLQIFATDLDPDAIAVARRGFYPANIAADLSPERLARFFVEEDHGYRVVNEIREMVVFAPHDVITDPPFTKLDILTCRNLLIYLDTALQKKLIPLFHYSLKAGGALLLGSSESIGEFTELFTPVDARIRLFRRTNNALRSITLEFPTHDFASKTETAMDAKPEQAAANLQNLVDQLLLEKFAPAAVLVNAAGDVLYISGRTGKYLEPAAGKANWNIHAMAREGLRIDLTFALPKALKSGESVICRNLRVGTNGGTQVIDLTIHPIAEPPALRGMALLTFVDVATSPQEAEPRRTGKSRRNPLLAEYEQALTLARHEQQALREEMQSSQEELKSANEEMQSTNEELQSTNEELTTSKEEMQSLNEELQSVNAELQAKVDELSTANNDLKNLLNSTDLATIFLDNTMRVRRFTSHATQLFKLIPGDIGRPLSDVTSALVYPEFIDDIRQVMNTLAFSDREVSTTDGRWFQVKVMPYRTQDNVIAGVVITFNEISRAKRLEAELRVLVARTD